MYFDTIDGLNFYLESLNELKEYEFMSLVDKNSHLIDGENSQAVKDNFSKIKFYLFGYTYSDFCKLFEDCFY